MDVFGAAPLQQGFISEVGMALNLQALSLSAHTSTDTQAKLAETILLRCGRMSGRMKL